MKQGETYGRQHAALRVHSESTQITKRGTVRRRSEERERHASRGRASHLQICSNLMDFVSAVLVDASNSGLPVDTRTQAKAVAPQQKPGGALARASWTLATRQQSPDTSRSTTVFFCLVRVQVQQHPIATMLATASVQDGYDFSRRICRKAGQQLQRWRLFIVKKPFGAMIQQTSVKLDVTCLPPIGGISTRPPVCGALPLWRLWHSTPPEWQADIGTACEAEGLMIPALKMLKRTYSPSNKCRTQERCLKWILFSYASEYRRHEEG